MGAWVLGGRDRGGRLLLGVLGRMSARVQWWGLEGQKKEGRGMVAEE